MFTRHVSRQLAAHLDGQLAPSKARQVELHLQQCPRCRAERDEISRGMAMAEHLPSVEAPAAIWSSLERAFPGNPSRQVSAPPRWRWAFAAALMVVLAGSAYWRFVRAPGLQWEVTRVDGAPSVGTKAIRGAGHIGAGEWIETDARSRATIQVGQIGSVEVAPNTRLRVVATRPDEHRLTLARGEIRATISAPPRLFFVDTASGTAVDLGCEYTLTSDETGAGLLRVLRGWVSFERQGLESLVPAGASCPTRGPGIPYFDDAPEELKRAVDAFGVTKTLDDPLNIILSESRARDTLTLFHLLSRVDGSDRARVFDRMAALTPVPAGVSREQALRLDPETLERWKDTLLLTW
ncbi:MAG TPA: zf-HC2 domain-containing protein [Bryobacteraceae bacterium]|nr:zf-HC2 domain-containing protein [Bryobacteraceae bacterium]